MNFFIFDGIVGHVTEQDAFALVRVCHKDSFLDRKTNEWKHEDNWITVSFFGKKREWALKRLTPGVKVIIEAMINTYPKDGPGQQLRAIGKQFYVIQKNEFQAPKQEVPDF